MGALNFTFDRLTYIDRLTAAGFDDKQARARAEALDAALRESVASKGDVQDLGHELRREIEAVCQDLGKKIADMRLEMRQMETRLEAKIETMGAILKVDILRWLIVTQVGLVGLAFAAAKFVK